MGQTRFSYRQLSPNYQQFGGVTKKKSSNAMHRSHQSCVNSADKSPSLSFHQRTDNNSLLSNQKKK